MTVVEGQPPESTTLGADPATSPMGSTAWRRTWPAYAIAVGLPAVCLLAYAAAAPPNLATPAVIVFVIPIMISAYIGGAGPGLLSTAVAVTGLGYLVAVASATSAPERWLVLVRWLALVPVGILVSVLSEALHRSRRRVEAALAARAEGEERLRRERALLRGLIDSIPDLIFFKDPNSVYLGCNKAFEVYSGRPEAELIGKTDLEMAAPEVAEGYRKADREMLASGRVWRGEEWIPFRTGGGAYFDTLKTPHYGPAGELLGLIGVSRDVSERKQAEQDLRLRVAALEAAANGIVIADHAGTIQWVNAAFTKLTGYSAQEVIGQNPRVLKSGRHDPVFYRELWDTITDGRVWHGEVVNKRKDGTLYSEEMTITPVRAVGQDITHFVAIKQDISERLRAEETRARLEEQLHAAQKLDALGTLAGGVAHDFNNILAVILGNVELAAEDVGPAHVAVGSLDEIRRAARRAQSLVQRILAFSREGAWPHERVALRQVVEDALAILRPAIPATVALTATCAEDTPSVEADATQIEQVLLNVCTNAWHALPESAGRIDVRVDAVAAGEGTANPRLGPPERWARVRVTDNGSGMDPTTLGRIFEPFFTTKPPGQGTGLGLSVVHGIVKAHGGVIEVASEPGGGTTFTIYLPAAPALEWNGSHHGTPPSDR